MGIKQRLQVLETKNIDNTPPAAIAVLMPNSHEERAKMAEEYENRPHVMIITECGRKCEGCKDPGGWGCRIPAGGTV